jgi:hypothetical protein
MASNHEYHLHSMGHRSSSVSSQIWSSLSDTCLCYDWSMPERTILLVHGTGVRLKGYQHMLDSARENAASVGINAEWIECAWGDPLGVDFDGKSLPDPPSEQQLRDREQDFARWRWLIDDPLFELNQLAIRDISHVKRPHAPPGLKPEWRELWDNIVEYQASPELVLLLKRGGATQFWPQVWSDVVLVSPIPKLAFERSAHELPEACHALARALVAQIHVVAVSQGHTGPNRGIRKSLVDRLVVDWKQQVYAPSDFFVNLFKRAATRVLRQYRNVFSDLVALQIGDVLLYQSRGAEVRKFIADKIATASSPVTVVAHSLGGVACFDLLASPDPPKVEHLVSVGSQSPLFYELGALCSLKPPELPTDFPRWMNVYDRNDFLSYVACRLLPCVQELEVDSGKPFPESHGDYINNPEVWQAIHDFIAE